MFQCPSEWSASSAPPRFGVRQMTRVRQDYFSVGAPAATRYALGFDQVLHHLWRARRLEGPIQLRRVHFLDDVILAAACLANIGPAWRDLAELHERALMRHARSRLEASEAVLLVRRAMHDMRAEVGAGRANNVPLARYVGDRPLRQALAEWIIEERHPSMTVRQTRSAGHASGLGSRINEVGPPPLAADGSTGGGGWYPRLAPQ